MSKSKTEAKRVIREYVPRYFSADDQPRIGQRVRFVPLGGVMGEPVDVYDAVSDEWQSVPVGSLCDVVDVHGSDYADVDLYAKGPDGEPVTFRVRNVSLPGSLMSIKGRPFVPGVDDRRHDLNGGGDALAESDSAESDDGDEALAEPVAVRGRVTPAVPRTPTPAAADALGALADALGVKLGGGLAEDDVRELIAESVDPLATAVGEVQGETATLTKRVNDAERTLRDAVGALATATPAVRARVRMAVTGKTGGGPIADALAKFYTIGEDRAVNLLLASPPSLGKSYAVREFGRMYDAYLEHGCSDDMDEISTLLGSPVPDGRGGFVTVDGVITQATRLASEGKSVLLLLDEILRLPMKVQEWLLSFLTGRKRPDGSREYVLRTRRALPDGTLEVITCDASNLHIVAATNLGMIAPVEAFWDRWETVRFAFDPATVRHVSKAVLDAYGVTGAVDKLAAAWTACVTESRKEVAAGTLRFPASIRMLERAAAASTTPDAAAVGRLLASRLVDNLAHWSADLGDTDADSAKVCTKWADALSAL